MPDNISELYGLFKNEEKVIDKTRETINSPEFENNALAEEYKFLAREYEKLNRQTKKMIRISDQQQNALNETKEELKHLNEISMQISRSLNFDDVFNSIMNYLVETYGFQGCSLALVDSTKEKYIIEKIILPDEYKTIQKQIEKISMPLDLSVGGISKSIVNNKIRYFQNIDPCKINDEVSRKPAEDLHIKTILIIPVSVDDEIIGAFTLTGHKINIDLSEEDISAILRFVNQISIIIKNSKLYGQIQIERASLEERVKERTQDLENALNLVRQNREKIAKQFSDSIEIIYSLIAKTSSRLYERTKEITTLCVMFSDFLGLDKQLKDNIRISAMLHDLGMIGMREKIIYEKKEITNDEKEFVHSHPQKSVEIIQTLQNIEDVKRIILQHHEHFDGSGYPSGLKGEEIDIGARILGVVSYFVDISKKRKFMYIDRDAKIKTELKSQKNKALDPGLTEKFLELIDKADLIYQINEKDIQFLEEGNEKIWIIPSNVHFENIIVGKVMDQVKTFNLMDDTFHIIDYGLCELVRNAIVHGNKYNTEKHVTIKFSWQKTDENKNKLIFKIIDCGEGMDVKSHSAFARARRSMLDIIDALKKFSKENNLNNDKGFNNLIRKSKLFMNEYYTDFYTFRQLDTPEATGGLGLLHVKKTFDTVEFNNVIQNNEISGTEVIVTKTV